MHHKKWYHFKVDSCRVAREELSWIFIKTLIYISIFCIYLKALFIFIFLGENERYCLPCSLEKIKISLDLARISSDWLSLEHREILASNLPGSFESLYPSHLDVYGPNVKVKLFWVWSVYGKVTMLYYPILMAKVHIVFSFFFIRLAYWVYAKLHISDMILQRFSP